MCQYFGHLRQFMGVEGTEQSSSQQDWQQDRCTETLDYTYQKYGGKPQARVENFATFFPL